MPKKRKKNVCFLLNICQSVALVIKKNYKKTFKLLFIKSKKISCQIVKKKSKNFKKESARGKKIKRGAKRPPPTNLLNYVSQKKKSLLLKGSKTVSKTTQHFCKVVS